MVRGIVFILITLAAWLALVHAAPAHIRHRPDLTDWLRTLYSQRSPCCDSTDAETMADPDWKSSSDKQACKASEPWSMIGGEEFHVCVRLQDQKGTWEWWQVPDSALVEVPNKAGPALIWMYWAASGKPFIRCFMTGTLS